MDRTVRRQSITIRRQRVEVLLHANLMLLLILFWAALAGCVVSSLIYDVGHWVHAW